MEQSKLMLCVTDYRLISKEREECLSPVVVSVTVDVETRAVAAATAASATSRKMRQDSSK